MKRSQLRQLVVSVGAVLFAMTAAVLATQYVSFLAAIENTVGDIRIAALHPVLPISKDIVLVTINEETLAQFPYRSPVDRKFMANLLKTLEKKGVRLIGLDMLFDQPTEVAKDQALKETIRRLKVPLFISYSNSPDIVNAEQLEYMKDFVPEALRASPHLGSDAYDGSVRWILPGADQLGLPMGFAHRAAHLMGMKPKPERLEIDWKPIPEGLTTPFVTFPAQTVAVLPDGWFKGKLVLIGGVFSITDRHRTPMSVVFDDDRGNMPGILVQAHSIAQLLEDRPSPRMASGFVWALSLLMALLGLLISFLKRGITFNVLAGAAMVLLLWAISFYGYTLGLPLLPLVAPTLAMALSLWIMDVLHGSVERKQRQFVQGAFSRYVSPAVVDHLLESPENLSISSQRKDLSFIFTDIAGFTTLSEKLSPEKLAEILNAYLDGACAVILGYEGTVDKFIGDAVMSIFNAPIPQEDYIERAVRCALDLDAYAEAFRINQSKLGIQMGHTRIGVHTGQAVIGNFGSSLRMEFTAFGDTVNTASRTEGVNKYFGTRICCTQAVAEACKSIAFRPIGNVVLKGKVSGVGLFTPVTDAESETDLYLRYIQAYESLSKEEQQGADMMIALGKHYPEDPLIQFHCERIQSGLISTRVVMEDK